jgi:hypothetical protein
LCRTRQQQQRAVTLGSRCPSSGSSFILCSPGGWWLCVFDCSGGSQQSSQQHILHRQVCALVPDRLAGTQRGCGAALPTGSQVAQRCDRAGASQGMCSTGVCCLCCARCSTAQSLPGTGLSLAVVVQA